MYFFFFRKHEFWRMFLNTIFTHFCTEKRPEFSFLKILPKIKKKKKIQTKRVKKCLELGNALVSVIFFAIK